MTEVTPVEAVPFDDMDKKAMWEHLGHHGDGAAANLIKNKKIKLQNIILKAIKLFVLGGFRVWETRIRKNFSILISRDQVLEELNQLYQCNFIEGLMKFR